MRYLSDVFLKKKNPKLLHVVKKNPKLLHVVFFLKVTGGLLHVVVR